MNLLQHVLNFSIVIIEPDDGVFGTYSISHNSSTGRVRLLSEKKVDIAGNYLFETKERSQVISFVPIGRQKIRLYTFKKIGTTLMK